MRQATGSGCEREISAVASSTRITALSIKYRSSRGGAAFTLGGKRAQRARLSVDSGLLGSLRFTLKQYGNEPSRRFTSFGILRVQEVGHSSALAVPCFPPDWYRRTISGYGDRIDC
jgi:hypothetical protein